VWTNGMTVGWGRKVHPIQRELKILHSFHTQKQYLLKPEGRWGLMPIINSLKKPKKARTTN
jgi:hypothetical protein